jgi:pimeloyl-ACP methyl ester carboxylesterase
MNHPFLRLGLVHICDENISPKCGGIVVPNSGHWIPEEQPQFVIKQLANFFGGNTTKTSK